jgi:hypothetical protein
VAESAEVQAECLLIGPELDRLLAECAPVEWTPGLVLLRPGAAEPPAYRGALAEYRTHVRSALDDLTYLSLTGLPVLESQSPPYADLTLCLIARAMLRGLATRLLGFEWSSCAYLGRNFLSSVSTVQCAGGRITVHLARPPLHVILSLAGIDGHVHALPWLGDTTFTVSLADG